LDFSDEALQAANTGYDKLLNTVRNLREELKKAETEQRINGPAFDISSHKKHFLEAMDDDFNAPLALGVLFDLARETNQSLNSEQKLSLVTLKQINQLFGDLGGQVLGIVPDEIRSAAGDAKTESHVMDLVVQIRAEVRKQKLWALSDIIRDGLKAIGFMIEDKKDSTSWRKIN
jgi:cysteinyl-tRNA synthetase